MKTLKSTILMALGLALGTNVHTQGLVSKTRGKAMKNSIGCIIAALGLVLATTPVWAVTVDETTGKGAFQDNAGNINSVQFKAGVDDAGNVFGQLQDTIQVPGEANVKLHGTVTCFDLLAPN